MKKLLTQSVIAALLSTFTAFALQAQITIFGTVSTTKGERVVGANVVVEGTYEGATTDTLGRFSPFLFKGTMFSTGGYSAEYGQALSSALVLNTSDVEGSTVTGISVSSVFVGASQTKKMGQCGVISNGYIF